MFTLTRTLLALSASTLLAVNASAQFIDTTSTWNGTSSVAPFGESNTATYGQTFKASAGFSNLSSFSFWLRTNTGPDGVDFAAYVMEWNSGLNRATGPILYQSSQQLLANPTVSMTQFSFNTGSLALDPTKQYIAFLSASNFFDGSIGLADVGFLNTDVYADGGFWFFNNGSNFGSLTASTWENFVGGGTSDLAFRANFGVGAVPEPSTYGIAAGGVLIGLAVLRRRRARASA